MFENAKNFKDSVVNWDVARVTDFTKMFAGIPHFNQAVGTWTARPNKMNGMFKGCTNFNQNLNDWDWSVISWDANNGTNDCFVGTSYNQDMSGVVFSGGTQATSWGFDEVPSWTGDGLGADACGTNEGEIDDSVDGGRPWGRPHYYSTEVVCKAEYNFGEVDKMGSTTYSMGGKKISAREEVSV